MLDFAQGYAPSSYDWLFDDPKKPLDVMVYDQDWEFIQINQPLGRLTVFDNYQTTVDVTSVNDLTLAYNSNLTMRADYVSDGFAKGNSGGYTDISSVGNYDLYKQVGGSTHFGEAYGNVDVDRVFNHYIGADNANGSQWQVEDSSGLTIDLFSFKEGEMRVEDVVRLSLYATDADNAHVDIQNVTGRVSVSGENVHAFVADSDLKMLNIDGEGASGGVYGSNIDYLYVGGADTFVWVNNSQVQDGYIGSGTSANFGQSFANVDLGFETEVNGYDSRLILELAGGNLVSLSGGEALIDADNDRFDFIKLYEGAVADIAADGFDMISFGRTQWSVDEFRGNVEAGQQTYHNIGEVSFTLTTPAQADDGLIV